MTKTDLRLAIGASSSTFSKLAHGEFISGDLTARICKALSCNVGDMMDVVLDDDYRELEEIEPLVQGELEKGQTFADQTLLKSSMNNPQHHALWGFYECLSKLIDAGKKYDYIILCFDRSHVGDEFPGTHPAENKVANFLEPFYAKGNVIWFVDNESPGIVNGSPSFWATPWRPSQFTAITPTGGEIFWKTYYSDLVVPFEPIDTGILDG